SAIVEPLGTVNDTASTAVNGVERKPPPLMLYTFVTSRNSMTDSLVPADSAAFSATMSRLNSPVLSPRSWDWIGVRAPAADWMRFDARLGAADTRRWVYGCCGFCRISRAGPDSTMR